MCCSGLRRFSMFSEKWKVVCDNTSATTSFLHGTIRLFSSSGASTLHLRGRLEQCACTRHPRLIGHVSHQWFRGASGHERPGQGLAYGSKIQITDNPLPQYPKWPENWLVGHESPTHLYHSNFALHDASWKSHIKHTFHTSMRQKKVVNKALSCLHFKRYNFLQRKFFSPQQTNNLQHTTFSLFCSLVFYIRSDPHFNTRIAMLWSQELKAKYVSKLKKVQYTEKALGQNIPATSKEPRFRSVCGWWTKDGECLQEDVSEGACSDSDANSITVRTTSEHRTVRFWFLFRFRFFDARKEIVLDSFKYLSAEATTKWMWMAPMNSEPSQLSDINLFVFCPMLFAWSYTKKQHIQRQNRRL